MPRRGSTGDDSDNDFSGAGGGSETDAGSGVTGDDGADTSFGGGDPSGGISGDPDSGGVGAGTIGDTGAPDDPDNEPSGQGGDPSGVVGGGGDRRGSGSDTTFDGGGSNTDAPSGVTGGDSETTFEGGPSEQNQTQATEGATGTPDPQADDPPDRGVSFTRGPGTGGEEVVTGAPSPRVQEGETPDRGVGITRGPEGVEITRPEQRPDRSEALSMSEAAASDAVSLSPAQQRDEPVELSRAERRAVVNQFGQRQLDATTRSEQFGDVAIENPATGNRIEDELRSAGASTRQFLGASVEAASRGAPAAGPLGTLAGLRQAEQTGFAIAEEAGFVEETPREGEFERLGEEAALSAADAFNPPAAAAEGKEIAEFAVTQPQRIASGGATAASEREDSILPGVVGDAVGAGRRGADTPFAQDVEQRTERVFATAEESFESDPTGTVASAAGGLAGGFAIGAGLGRAATRVPGISGSDVSGRILQGAGRALQRGRRSEFLSDDRAQADLTLGGRRDVQSDTDDLPDEIAGTEPVPEDGPQVFADPSDALADRGPDIDAGDAFARRRERTAQQADAPEQETTTGVLGDQRPTRQAAADGRDLDAAFQRRREQAQERSVDADDTAPPGTDALAAAVGTTGAAVPELLGETEAEQATESVGELFGRTDLTDSGAAVGGDLVFRSDVREDVGTRSDFRTDGRVDSRLDLDSRQDVRQDNRQDTRLDTRQDSRFDTRLDTRADTRVDSRADTRADTRVDLRFDREQRIDPPGERDDDDDDDPLGGAFGTRSNPFENPVETPAEFLGVDEP